MGYVALANMFPWVVEKWNSSRNIVIFPISHLSNLEFLEFFQEKCIVHFILLKWYSQITQWCVNPYQGITMLLPSIIFSYFYKGLCGALGRVNKISYLYCICCKVKSRIQGEKCHILRSRCGCVL